MMWRSVWGGWVMMLLLAPSQIIRLDSNDCLSITNAPFPSLAAQVTGEVMQMRADGDDLVDMQYYLRKTFYKTASLVAHACKAAAKLGGQGPDVQKLAFQASNADVLMCAEDRCAYQHQDVMR